MTISSYIGYICNVNLGLYSKFDLNYLGLSPLTLDQTWIAICNFFARAETRQGKILCIYVYICNIIHKNCSLSHFFVQGKNLHDRYSVGQTLVFGDLIWNRSPIIWNRSTYHHLLISNWHTGWIRTNFLSYEKIIDFIPNWIITCTVQLFSHRVKSWVRL